MRNLGLSIKGGSVRGLGSIGFVRMLQEAELKPTVIGGSSSGGMVATMYAMGYSWEKMVEAVRGVSIWRMASLVHLFREGSLIPWDNFRKTISNFTPDINIEDLPVKLVLYVSDIKNQERICLDRGSLIDALAASCAYPFLFPSVRIGHRKFIDGDLTSSYSADVIRAKGARKVIGVGYKMDKRKVDFGKGLDKAIDIYRYLGYQVEKEHDHLNPVDFDFRYSAGDISYFDFNSIDRLVERSYRHACLNRDKLLLSLS